MRHFRYKHFRDEQTKKYVNPFNRGLVRNFFDSLDVGIPKIIQPTPVGNLFLTMMKAMTMAMTDFTDYNGLSSFLDWRRCYTLKDVETFYNDQASPSKFA